MFATWISRIIYEKNLAKFRYYLAQNFIRTKGDGRSGMCLTFFKRCFICIVYEKKYRKRNSYYDMNIVLNKIIF